MSADKPEVGDVWEINDPNVGTYKALVINTTDFVHPYCITDDFQGAFLWRYSTETYVGKSKASVNDLFQTEQDVANNVAKSDLQHLQAENNRLRETLKSQIKALLALKGFYPETSLFADDNIRRIKQSLNGESEEK